MSSFPDSENVSHYFTILNSKTRPEEFGTVDYDIHVYFNSLQEREQALALRESMRTAFDGKHLYLGELINVPVGPHRVPQWEGNFQAELLPEVFMWLMANRGDIKVFGYL